jgi:hypothetical protein
MRRHWWQPDPEHAPSHALSPDIRSWATGNENWIVIVVGFLNAIIGESTIVYRVHSCISQLLLENSFYILCHSFEDSFSNICYFHFVWPRLVNTSHIFLLILCKYSFKKL